MAKQSKKRVEDPGSSLRRLQVRDLGPIHNADVQFGDLTTLVGPQATGKSVFLQTLKLAIDHGAIRRRLEQSDAIQSKDPGAFLQLLYGEGMQQIWHERTEVVAGEFAVDIAHRPKSVPGSKQKLFYIPAQRVMSLRDGFTRTFGDYKAGDPFVLRTFSQELHDLIQSEFLAAGTVFPKRNRLSGALRRGIARAIYGSFELAIEQHGLGRRFVLRRGSGGDDASSLPLPFLVWSAGQREFTPLLLGLYRLLPPARGSKREGVDWVVIEEPEAGLHPRAIGLVMALVLELLHRGYRVVLSTHSPTVLDVQWVLGRLQKLEAPIKDVCQLFGLPAHASSEALARKALALDLRSYFFAPDGVVKDVSSLDPGSPDEDIAGWGGLTGFASETGAILSRAVNRAEGFSR